MFSADHAGNSTCSPVDVAVYGVHTAPRRAKESHREGRRSGSEGNAATRSQRAVGGRTGRRGMKRVVVLMACLAPAMAFAQEKTYTNADLAKFQVPGAYTNQDLKKLPPMPVQKTPAATLPRYEPAPVPSASLQAWYDNVRVERDDLAAELEYEKSLVEFSESAFAGDTRSFDVRLGYRAQAVWIIRELEKRVALLDRQLEEVADAA